MGAETTQPVLGSQIQLEIGGMTCASCAARIEKKLNRMDGVTASVNYSTEKAKVTFADTVTTDDLIAPVSVGEYMRRTLPDATLEIIENVGHCPHLSAPSASVSAMERFLQRSFA